MIQQRKVKIRLRGGLGNQLFQISAAASLADSCKIPLKIITRDLEEGVDQSRGNFLPELELDKIIKFASLESSITSESYLANRLHHRFNNLNRGTLIDTCEKLSEAIANQVARYYRVEGFFQDIKFVQTVIHRNPRVSLLKLRPEVADISRLVESPRTITLHIRLGDFLDNELDILSSEYFQSAVSEFMLQLSEVDSKVVVFSDDITAAHLMLGGNTDFYFPEQYLALSPPELLYVLSKSSNFVISKSTLSWWGGYIGYLNGSRIWSPWRNRFEIY